MADLLTRAAKFDRGAMRKLYDSKKQQAYFVASKLLGDDAVAEEIVAFAYATVWSNLASVGTVTELNKLVMTAVVERCKKQLSVKNSKAFRIPDNRRFLINTVAPVTDSEDVVEAVLSQLPVFQRTLFILSAVDCFDETELAAAVKLDVRTLETALADNKSNIERMLVGTSYSYDDTLAAIAKGQDSVAVPSSLNTTVEKQIGTYAAPLEKKRRLRLLYITIAVVASCALIGGMCWAALTYFAHKDSLPGAADPNTQPTAQNEFTSTDSTAGDANEQGYTEEDIKDNPALGTVGTVTSVTPTHYAEITIQDRGTIKVGLDANIAPLTVNNFKTLADEKFYDGLTLHRIMEGFMMQGGDPLGNGTGGSENDIVGEFAENQIENPLSHVRGAISMARANNPNSASSQFFIVHKDSTFLDGKYAAFGYVTEGMDIVDAICTEAKPVDNNGTIPATEQPIITSITVYEAV